MNRDLGQIIARNYIFGFGAQIVLRLLSWLFSVYVIRGLGAAEYGKYTQVLAFIAIFSVLGDLGVSTYAGREIAKDHVATRQLFWNIRALRFMLAFVVILVSTGSAWLLGRSEDILLGIFFASSGLFLYVFQGTTEFVLTGYERVDYVSVLTMVSQGLYLVFGVVVMVKGLGFLGLIFATWPGLIVFILLGGWLVRHRLHADTRLQLTPGSWIELIRSGLPFGLTTLTNMLSFRLDTILLGIWVTNTAIGNYNAAYNLIFTLLTLTASLNSALLPSLSRYFMQDPTKTREIYQRVMRYLFIFSLPIAVGTTILAREIILTLYGEDLSGAIRPLQILIWVLPVLTFTSLCGSITTVFHLEKKTARINAINALVNFSINILVIPFFGILGASVATVFTEIVGIFQFGFVLREHFDWAVLTRSLFQPLLAALIMGAGVFILRDTLQLWSIGAGVLLYLASSYLLGVWDLIELKLISKTMLRGLV